MLKLSKGNIARNSILLGESLKLDPNYSSAVEQKIHSLKMLGRKGQAEVLLKDLEESSIIPIQIPHK